MASSLQAWHCHPSKGNGHSLSVIVIALLALPGLGPHSLQSLNMQSSPQEFPHAENLDTGASALLRQSRESGPVSLQTHITELLRTPATNLNHT